QYLGRSWTGCGPRLRVLGAKNRTEPDLKTLGTMLIVRMFGYRMMRRLRVNAMHTTKANLMKRC
ncbi:hypothetical protein K443DRAFT_109650, partial [Laccaria amethystina LaAM-08-1]